MSLQIVVYTTFTYTGKIARKTKIFLKKKMRQDYQNNQNEIRFDARITAEAPVLAESSCKSCRIREHSLRQKQRCAACLLNEPGTRGSEARERPSLFANEEHYATTGNTCAGRVRRTAGSPTHLAYFSSWIHSWSTRARASLCFTMQGLPESCLGLARVETPHKALHYKSSN